MLYKPRTKSQELILLELLNKRMELDTKTKNHYFSLKKGYEGEVEFDRLTAKIKSDCLILNDLLLEVNNTTFQVDSLIITQDKMYLFEVKNFEGNYYYEDNKLFKIPKSEYNNPLNQLNRSASLMRQLLPRLGSQLTIDASIVFIHPEFTLYQAPLDKPIILPGQMDKLIESLNETHSKLTSAHYKIAKKLVDLHITESRYQQLPSYKYNQIQKGIICKKCSSFSIHIDKRYGVCKTCDFEEAVTKLVVRSVTEFKNLFPNEKITVNIIHDWCKIVESKKRIRRILQDNFKAYNVKRWTYYE